MQRRSPSYFESILAKPNGVNSIYSDSPSQEVSNVQQTSHGMVNNGKLNLGNVCMPLDTVPFKRPSKRKWLFFFFFLN